MFGVAHPPPLRDLPFEALVQLRRPVALERPVPGHWYEPVGTDHGPRQDRLVGKVAAKLPLHIGDHHDVVVHTLGQQPDIVELPLARVAAADEPAGLDHPPAKTPDRPGKCLAPDLILGLRPDEEKRVTPLLGRQVLGAADRHGADGQRAGRGGARLRFRATHGPSALTKGASIND